MAIYKMHQMTTSAFPVALKCPKHRSLGEQARKQTTEGPPDKRGPKCVAYRVVSLLNTASQICPVKLQSRAAPV